jgi:hypothetical protein
MKRLTTVLSILVSLLLISCPIPYSNIDKTGSLLTVEIFITASAGTYANAYVWKTNGTFVPDAIIQVDGVYLGEASSVEFLSGLKSRVPISKYTESSFVTVSGEETSW